MIIELLADFGLAVGVLPAGSPKRRRVELVLEALARNAEFVSRHPRCLFQQLWNLCWWYDHSDAAQHYAPGDAESDPLPGEPLHTLADRWRDDRARAESGGVWLRALQPPAVPLGSRLRVVLSGHARDVCAVAWSPDGRLLLTGSDDGTGRVWDATSGLELTVLNRHTKVVGVAWSADGQFVATGTDDGAVCVWDTGTWLPLVELVGTGVPVSAMAWEPTRPVLAIGREDGVTFWRAVAPDHVREHGSDRGVVALAWSESGNRLAVAETNGRVLELRLDGSQVSAYPPQPRAICHLNWSSGTLWSFGTWDGAVRLCNAETGAELVAIRGHQLPVFFATMSPDGRHLATCAWDHTVGIWDRASGQLVRTLNLPNCITRSAVWSPDGRFVATGSYDRVTRVWNATDGAELRCFTGSEDTIRCVAWSPDGDRIAVAGADLMVRVWDLKSDTNGSVFSGHARAVMCVAWSPDGRLLASGSWDGDVRVWAPGTGTATTALRGHTEAANALAWAPDGRFLATGSDDGTARVWDVATGHEQNCFRVSDGPILSIAWSPCGGQLATGTKGAITVWTLNSAAPVARTHLPNQSVCALIWGIAGSLLAVASWDGSFHGWRADAPDRTVRFSGHIRLITGVRASPDGTAVASVSNDHTLKVWDATTGRDRFVLRGHLDAIRSVAWAPDGRAVATASEDRTVRVWHVGPSGRIPRTRVSTAPPQSDSFGGMGFECVITGTPFETLLGDARGLIAALSPPLWRPYHAASRLLCGGEGHDPVAFAIEEPLNG